jgi:hypothetical protein
MKGSSIWSARDAQHQAYFAALLKPAVRASATTLFDDETVGREVVQAWIMQLHDVPRDVLEAGFARVFGQGITWMPKPGEVRAACAAVIDDRRRAVAAQARQLMEACEVCTVDHRGWREVTAPDGIARMQRCECHKAAMLLTEAQPARLALPPAREDVTSGSAA